ILSALSNHPGMQAIEIAELVALDKPVVSRRLRRLAGRGLVGSELEDSRRGLYLTRAGAEVHDAVLPVALEREQRMLAGFSAEERAQLRDFLHRMHANIPLMNAGSAPGGDQP
ncbi:MarR family transcriptional regulator, partial [Arthrobacter deserti]|nr:MarR family transcriptional regulator [Arthrobacter deserti]